MLKTEMANARRLAKERCDANDTDVFVGKERKWMMKVVHGKRGAYQVFTKLRGNLKQVDAYIAPPIGTILRSGMDAEKHVRMFGA